MVKQQQAYFYVTKYTTRLALEDYSKLFIYLWYFTVTNVKLKIKYGLSAWGENKRPNVIEHFHIRFWARKPFVEHLSNLPICSHSFVHAIEYTSVYWYIHNTYIDPGYWYFRLPLVKSHSLFLAIAITKKVSFRLPMLFVLGFSLLPWTPSLSICDHRKIVHGFHLSFNFVSFGFIRNTQLRFFCQ